MRSPSDSAEGVVREKHTEQGEECGRRQVQRRESSP